MTQFHLYLPQMRMTLDTVADRAGAAEAAGFDGIALMDHLAPPLAEQHAMHDAMVSATWLAAHTRTATISHLVLCDAFRHPAVLAKQVVGIDHASSGRFELGLGWGSVPSELERFGVGTTETRPRIDRMRETIEVLRLLWSGSEVDYDGDHHRLRGAIQSPTPTRDIPIVIGGAGKRTMELVAEHATWWNCPAYAFERFGELRASAGPARPSLQLMVSLVLEEHERAEVEARTARRFGPERPDIVLGSAAEVAERLDGLAGQGVERFYVWFTDFAQRQTLVAFGANVMPHIS